MDNCEQCIAFIHPPGPPFAKDQLQCKNPHWCWELCRELPVKVCVWHEEKLKGRRKILYFGTKSYHNRYIFILFVIFSIYKKNMYVIVTVDIQLQCRKKKKTFMLLL